MAVALACAMASSERSHPFLPSFARPGIGREVPPKAAGSTVPRSSQPHKRRLPELRKPASDEVDDNDEGIDSNDWTLNDVIVPLMLLIHRGEEGSKRAS